MRMTTEPSTICKDGTAEGSQMWIMANSPSEGTNMKMREAMYWWSPNGRPCSRSSTARRGRENGPKLGSMFLWSARQWDSDVPGPPARGFTLVLGRKAGTRRKPGLGPLHQPWKTKHGAISLDLSTAGRPWGRGKTRRWPRRTSWQEDRQEGGRVGEGGNYGAGTSPAGALAHRPCCHTKGVPFALASKTGGRGRGIFFFFPLSVGAGAPIWGSHSRVGEQYCYTHWYVAWQINR